MKRVTKRVNNPLLLCIIDEITLSKYTKRITTISMFVGLVVVLQIIATFINFGGFPITLTLVPIIVGGAIYGPKVGAILGTAFGVVVALMVITGADPSGAAMLAAKPLTTVTACILKGTLAGFFSALVYEKMSSKNSLAAILLSSAVAPIVYTGTLAFTIIAFFDGAFITLIALFVTVNFVIELLIDVLLAPGLLRIIDRQK